MGDENRLFKSFLRNVIDPETRSTVDVGSGAGPGTTWPEPWTTRRTKILQGEPA